MSWELWENLPLRVKTAPTDSNFGLGRFLRKAVPFGQVRLPPPRLGSTWVSVALRVSVGRLTHSSRCKTELELRGLRGAWWKL